MEVDQPLIMGILNATPDSFYGASRMESDDAMRRHAAAMVYAGADIIDIGGCSTRPGYSVPDAEEEWSRVKSALDAVKEVAPSHLPISVDTFRARVALQAIEAGADIINDISACTLDSDMFNAVCQAKVPYILTHPSQSRLHAGMSAADTVATVLAELSDALRRFRLAGVNDVIADIGLGFGKTISQNYELVANLDVFGTLGCPLMVGASRKSMLYKPLNLTPDDVLPATIALNTAALLNGASIIRVHDVEAARQTRAVVTLLHNNNGFWN